MPIRIIHITAHLGGGAGKAISGLVKACHSEEEQHKILLLELPEKRKYVDECEQAGIEVLLASQVNWRELVCRADVLVVSWWQHPLMPQILCELSDIPCRVLLWSHVNGCVYPYLPAKLMEVADGVLFTTWYSMENPYWSEELKRAVQKKACLVSGMGDFHPAAITPKSDYAAQEYFTIGYMGTLNYAKLHPDFWLYCKAVVKRIPKVQFLMVGDCSKEFMEEAAQYGLKDHVLFAGYVENVYPYLQKMDIFGYLLSPDNYATTENALLEAMAAGLPVIVQKNKPEQYIVKANETGYFVENAEQYADMVDRLWRSEKLRRQVGEAAREDTIHRYSLRGNVESFRKCVMAALQEDKSPKPFDYVFGATPLEWFLSCTGGDKELFETCIKGDSDLAKVCPMIYREQSKSSIFHFRKYYCEDAGLECLANKLL